MSAAKKTERSHPGLCLDLLDDEHKALFRELAFLVQALDAMGHPTRVWARRAFVCPVCDASVTATADELTSDATKVQLDHKPHCAAMHAQRLRKGDRVLETVGNGEYVQPTTPAAVAWRDHMNKVIQELTQANGVTP